MVNTSIVFDPDVDDRALDREVDQIDSRLQEVGEITPEIDERQLDDISVGIQGDGGGGGPSVVETAMLGVQERTLKWQKESAQEDVERNQILSNWGRELKAIRERIPMLAGEQPSALEGGDVVDVGGPGGGVGGAGQAAGIGALASKIPKPIAGVATSAAMPIAIAGGVGIGMLKALEGTSGRLAATNSMFGTAMDLFFKPFGDYIGRTLRPLSRSLLNMASGFNKNISANGLVIGGMQSLLDFANNLPGELGKIIVRTWGQALEGLFGESQFFSAMQDFKWSDWIPIVKWDDLIGSGFDMIQEAWPGWPKIGELWPGFPQIKAEWPGWPDLGNLWPGWETFIPKVNWDIPDFLTGDGSNGNGEDDTTTTTTTTTTTDRPPRPPPKGPNGRWEWSPHNRAWRWVEDTVNTSDDTLFGPTSGTGLQRGGVVRRRTRATLGEAGPEVVQPLSEFERLAERIGREASGGGGQVDTAPVERKLDTLHRDLQRLMSVMGDMALTVEGERFGRLTTETRHNQAFDTDALTG